MEPNESQVSQTPQESEVVVAETISTSEMLSPRKLLSSSWAIYKKHYKFFIKFCLTWIGMFIATSIPVAVCLIIGPLTQNLVLIILGFILALPVIYVGIWFAVILIRINKQIIDTDSTPSIRLLFKKESRKGVMGYIGLSLLTGIIILGGIILFVIPGIIFAIWFALAGYVLVIEGKSIKSSLVASKKLVRGRWWKTLWYFFYGGIIQFACYFLVGVIVAIIGGYLGQALDFIGRVILGFIWTPLLGLYMYRIYEQFKAHPVQKQTEA